ncbi:Arginyl-tRNA--protein transferase 1 [Vermiconidia calcicola]|uniref:Arginyl-tRNA--protein transferase 1 n=1 Tax=Vermiconidia calcicola TaxID=1690605 RepID=A0ACC3M936_9PEZI|nr:Arginyl-tRNA--protein transferase 1 [Vermiconidia calcicola]
MPPELKPSRDQRQALHRWNRYVLGESYIKEVNRRHPKSKEEKKRQSNTFDLVTTVHESEQTYLKPDIQPEHRFEVTLEPDEFTEEKYQLFGNYQRHVHHEGANDISRGGFKRFLCATPLHRHDFDGKKLGSFHQMYRLDGRLIAMSVLDLLPHAVSGVYFIYHSDFESWSFGKLSALREAALAIEQGYDLYYMGYFIWSCKKMRYKGDYKPQTVLDYDTLDWDVMDNDMRQLMDKRKWVSMSRERKIQATLQAPPASEKEGRQDSDEEKIAADVYGVELGNPITAMNAGLSLLEMRMPGVMELEQLEEEVDLDEMKITLGRGTVHEMQDLASWSSGSITDPTSLKSLMGELAACIGPNLARDVVVDLSR